jgi:hypothetical protein
MLVLASVCLSAFSLFIKEDRLSEAEPLCRRSLALLERIYGDRSPTLARALLVLAEVRHWQVARSLDHFAYFADTILGIGLDTHLVFVVAACTDSSCHRYT